MFFFKYLFFFFSVRYDHDLLKSKVNDIQNGLESSLKQWKDHEENLEVLLNYDFPEHYGEILNFLLEASQNQTLCKSTWYTFLNSLTDGKILQRNNITSCNYNENKFSIKHLKQYFIQCAGDQKISLDIVRGTINVLGTLIFQYFKNRKINQKLKFLKFFSSIKF